LRFVDLCLVFLATSPSASIVGAFKIVSRREKKKSPIIAVVVCKIRGPYAKGATTILAKKGLIVSDKRQIPAEIEDFSRTT